MLSILKIFKNFIYMYVYIDFYKILNMYMYVYDIYRIKNIIIRLLSNAKITNKLNANRIV